MYSFAAIIVLCLATFASAEYAYPGTQAYQNDINLLQYALTLEQLESAFYNQGIAALNSSFAGAGLTQETIDLLYIIREHEMMHVATIRNILSSSYGVKPVDPCSYTFDFSSVNTFLQSAATLENTGVSAYDGAISFATDEYVLAYAASVAVVEARHAAFLNNLTGSSPFPSNLDQGKTPAEIVAMAKGFLGTCPQTLTYPQSADLFRNQTLLAQTVKQSGSPVYLNDNKALQFALTSENLGSSYYSQGLAKFNESAFAAAGFSNQTYQWFGVILAHEQAHEAALSMTISGRQATPVSPCNYKFNFTTVQDFITTAAFIENTEVSAYGGAAADISDLGLLSVAASIATVEARHASYLNKVLGKNPFPNVADPLFDVNTTLSKISPLIASCPFDFSVIMPSPADSFRQNQTLPVTLTTASVKNFGTSLIASVTLLVVALII